MDDQTTPPGAEQLRPVRTIMRFVERRTARSAAHVWLGSAVAEAREPKLLAEATRLAPASRPPEPAPPPLVSARAEPEDAPAASEEEPVKLTPTYGMDSALAWIAAMEEKGRLAEAGEDGGDEAVAAAPRPAPAEPVGGIPMRAARIDEGAAPQPAARIAPPRAQAARRAGQAVRRGGPAEHARDPAALAGLEACAGSRIDAAGPRATRRCPSGLAPRRRPHRRRAPRRLR